MDIQMTSGQMTLYLVIMACALLGIIKEIIIAITHRKDNDKE